MRLVSAMPYVRIRRLCFTLLSVLLGLGAFLNAGYSPEALAQTGTEGPWSSPVNLSNSGGVTATDLVVDASGMVHVIWQEDEIGYNYARFADGEWSQPVSRKFPFEDTSPILVAGEEYVYAFWIKTSAANTLYTSRAQMAKIGEANGWEAPKKLAKNVIGLSAAYQTGGRMHLAYIHYLEEQDQPEGVLYIQSLDKGVKWSTPQLIYSSKYFRSIKPDQVNIQVTAAGEGDQAMVSAVWDNPALKRVFSAQSADGGKTWEAASEVDGPAVEAESNSPFRLRLAVNGDWAVRVWQGNLQSGINCTQYYQYSKDRGRTWSERAQMLKNARGCADRNDLMLVANDRFLLQSTFPDEVYLSAFVDGQWSDPQLQSPIKSFENPATADLVTLVGQKPWLLDDGRLYVVGYSESSPADAWVLWREITDMGDWFPRPSSWGAPLQVTLGDETIYAAKGVADQAERVHIIWTQDEPAGTNEIAAPKAKARSIYYAVWDGEKLSNPVKVLGSPDNFVGEFSLAYDSSRDRLALVWEAGKRGEIYFSWADAVSAASALEWSAPVSLPLVESLGRTPDIGVRTDGAIFVAYTIPVNEYRGVYLVKSTDGGVTWSQPIRVFNASGVAQMVDRPKLALSGSNAHLLWAQNTVLSDPGPINLSYAQSSDDGETWSAPAAAVNEPVDTWWLVSAGDVGIQRFWMLSDSSGLSLYQDYSQNGGGAWSLPTNLTGLGESLKAVDFNVNSATELRLAQIVEDANGALLLRIQNWSPDAWKVEDTLTLDEATTNPIFSLDSEWLSDGHYAIFYAIQRKDFGDGKQPWEIVLRVRNPNAASVPSGTAASAGQPTAAAASPTEDAQAAVTAQPTAAAGTEEAAVPQETPTAAVVAQTAAPLASAQPVETAISTGDAAMTLQTTPLASPGRSTVVNSNLGLYLAAGVSVLVVAVFFVYSLYRRSS